MNKDPLDLDSRREQRHLLVENKVSFQGPDSELSIYDTYRAASRVGLGADQLLFCGMVTGKKVMHSVHDGLEKDQVFLPHESYVMSPGEFVEIDFPEANEAQPTTCLTIEISKERIETVSEKMRDITQLGMLQHDWQYQPHIVHTHHTAATQQLLEKLVSLFTHNHPDKEMMVDLGVSELVIRLLREQGREQLLEYCRQSPDATGISSAINYLTEYSALPLDIDALCRLACMSRSKLYIEFKKQLGCSPSEYLQQQRLKNAAKLLQAGNKVSEVCYHTGFNDLSHFSRRFSRFFGQSPTQYRNHFLASNTIK
ncbi:MAG: AraC family transcriptional regulator N-terminal domain-containing protein [Methylophaga sp.]|nr:AraC family transcriptional regulator N-terminal domain-containing protein [Methylophaga sp.]